MHARARRSSPRSRRAGASCSTLDRHRARGASGRHRRDATRRREPAGARRAARARKGGDDRAPDVPDAVVIGSDTIVVVDGDVLGKPRDEAHAARDARAV